MTSLISEITKRLPDRWLARTLGPGALWLLIATLSIHFRHSNPFGVFGLAAIVRDASTVLRERPTDALVYGVFALAGAVGVSTATRAGGGATRRLWSGRWGAPFDRLATALTARRRRKRATELSRSGTRLPAAFLPATPTWIGDRLRLTDVRIDAQYGLSLALVWPRIWQLVDADTRTLVRQARERYDAASTLVGWAGAYLLLAAVWWPAVLPAALLALAGWRRGRVAATLFCETVESTVDLHHRPLATALGHALPEGTALSPTVADAINDQLHKGATPQPHPDSGSTHRG